MSDEQGQGLKGLLAGVSSAWDWAAIAAGAGAGAVATIVTGGADLGSSIAAGATCGLATKKALEATLAKRKLRSQLTKKSENLLPLLQKHSHNDSLARRLNDEIELWKEQISSDAEFSEQLKDITNAYRKSRTFLTVESAFEML